MAYEKQTWVCDETITADKLNHMEDGIANASSGEHFVVTFTTSDLETATADKTYAEIAEAFNSGKHLVGHLDTGLNVMLLWALEFSSGAVRFANVFSFGSGGTHVATSMSTIECAVRSDNQVELVTMTGRFVTD